MTEKSIEEEGCCGDLKVANQSKIKNPKNPKKEISDSLLKKLEEKSRNLGITNIGYAKIPEDIFDNNDMLMYSNAIVLTYPIAMDIINEIPGETAKKLNDTLYEKFGNITNDLSDYLREKKFVTQVAHPFGGLTDLSKLGQVAGLGYIGKNGLLISPELGPRLKVSAILTTIENLHYCEKNPHKWIEKYCKRCGKCVKGCPEDALIVKNDKIAKADIMDEKCIGCSQGCTYCIESCPFFKNGYNWLKNFTKKMEIR